MKNIKKIASLISGIILSTQPLVGAISSDHKYYLEAQCPNGEVVTIILSRTKYKDYSNAMTYANNILKLPKIGLKYNIYTLAKDIRNKNLPRNIIDNIIEELLKKNN